MAKIKGTPEEAMQKIDRPGSLNMHELHGTDTPPHSRELEGSPGVKRHELPARRSMRRGSVYLLARILHLPQVCAALWSIGLLVIPAPTQIF